MSEDSKGELYFSKKRWMCTSFMAKIVAINLKLKAFSRDYHPWVNYC